MDAIVIGSELQVGRTFVQHQPAELPPVNALYGSTRSPYRAYKRDQLCLLRPGDVGKSRHPATGQAVVKQRRKLIVTEPGQAIGDVGAPFSTPSITPADDCA